MNPEKLISALNWRYATKCFDKTKKIDDEIWKKLEKILILSPSSFGLQPYKFLVIQDQELRKKLRPHSWNQSQIEDCSHLVVFLGKKILSEDCIKNYVDLIAKTRNIPVESLAEYQKLMIKNLLNDKKDIVNWAAKQAYIALGNLLTAAAIFGIDTCPMEGMSPEQYDEILGLKHGRYTALCACAFGFRDKDDKYQNLQKVRFSEENLIERK